MEREYLGPAVVDGVIQYLSVSSMEKFDPNTFGGCPSKWHIRYIRGVKEERKRATDYGDAVHAQLKHYLLTGQNGLFQRMQSMLKFVPAPGPGLVIEEPIPTLTYAGIRMIGFIDVRNHRGEYINESGDITTENVPEVIDWKTTKSIADYAKTDLKSLIQMSGYADSLKVDRVRLSHVYGQTEGEHLAKKVTQIISLTEIEQRRYYHEKLVREMVDVAREPETKKVPYHLESCTAFRACPYQGICPHFGGGTAKGKVMSLLSKMKALNGATSGVAPTPPLEPIQAVVTPTPAPIQAVVTPMPPPEPAVATPTPSPEPAVATPTPAPIQAPAEPVAAEPVKRTRKAKTEEGKVKEITLGHTVTVNLGNYSSAKVEIRITAEGDDFETLSKTLRERLEKELADYTEEKKQ